MLMALAFAIATMIVVSGSQSILKLVQIPAKYR